MLNTQSEETTAYWRVFAFAAAAFIFNTTEFIPVALLSDMAADFRLPVAQMGWMMTVYAWVVSLSSLPLMLWTAKYERRKLLIYLFILFMLGHLLSVLAWRFEVLVLARVVVALAHALFWAITAALVMRVAPKGKQHKALAWLSVGTSLAMILGLPMGRVIGQWFGWRVTLGLIGVAALIVLIVLMKLLPKLPSQNAGSLKSVPILCKRPLLMGLYGFTVLVVTAHFTAYSYIEPFSLNISQMTANEATAILLVFGASGICASILFGRLHGRYPNRFLWSAIGGLIVVLALLLPLSQSIGAMFVLIFAWGVAISCLSLTMIVRVLQYAPDATDVATALYSGIFNIGIGGGAFLGGMIMKNVHLGLASIGWVGAILAVLAWVVLAWSQRQFKHTLADIPKISTTSQHIHH